MTKTITTADRKLTRQRKRSMRITREKLTNIGLPRLCVLRKCRRTKTCSGDTPVCYFHFRLLAAVRLSNRRPGERETFRRAGIAAEPLRKLAELRVKL
jgi:hypothetical protein